MNKIALWITALVAAGMLAACGGGGTVVSVSIDAQTTLISLTGRTQLSPTVTGSTNTAVTWSTSDPSVATVDANGIVEANGAGSADITATSVTDTTKSATVTITVGDFTVDGVTISAASTTVEVGSDLQLGATVQPSSVPQGVLWSSSDTGVATVDDDGLVTGQSVGTVVVTARSAANIDVQAQITIDVVAAGGGGTVTSVTIDDPNPTGPDQVQIGGTLDLTVTVVADPGTSTAVTWSSSADVTATVDENGLVTGVSDGTVTVTAVSVADTSVSDTIDITVIDGTVTGVSIDNRPPGDELLVDVTRDLDATVTGTGTFGQDVLWTSSAPGVATIDVDGIVTGVGEGTTVITAVAASDTNVDDSFTLTVTDVSVDCSSPSTLSSVDTDTDLPLGCYTVGTNQTVAVTAALTLEAGTIVEFGQGARIEAGFGGSITANGSGAAPIVFRGTNPSPGFWDGVRFVSLNAANQLDFVEISDAGDGGYAGVYVESTGSVSITNSRISNSTVGLNAENGGEISAFANNEFSGNGRVAEISPMHLTQLDDATDYDGSVSGNANSDNYLLVRSGDAPSGTWPATDAPFRVLTNNTIDVIGGVVVSPGATLEFESGARLDIESGGSLNAVGSASERIVLRGSSDAVGFWDGINVVSNDANNVLAFVDVSDAGDAGYAGVYVQSTGAVAITDSRITNSIIGLNLENGATLSAFSGNAFSANGRIADIYPVHLAQVDAATDYDGNTLGAPNTDNFLRVRSGDAGAGTWPATDAPFRALTNNVINVTGDVVVSPGATLEFEAGARLDVEAGGSLDASGTSSDRITFQGSSPSVGLWDGINIVSANANVLDFVDVSHGGDAGYANLYVQSTGNVTVTNSSFTDSSGFGIEVEAGGNITPSTEADLIDPADGNNTFSNNTDGPTNL